MKKIFLIIITLFSVTLSNAQWVGDVLSWEALISDHKAQYRVLQIRTMTETGLTALHKATENHTKDYQEINKQLDKYNKAFDILSVVLDGLETGFEVYGVISEFTSSDGIAAKYVNLIRDFSDKCASRGDIYPEDTLIISIAYQSINSIKGDLTDVETSLVNLFMLCSGQIHCTTHDLSLLFTRLNNAVTRIHIAMRQAYFETYKYISARTSFWKRDIYKGYDKLEVSTAALRRWEEARQRVLKFNTGKGQ